jgi:pSer/pThr/pTyr-binding forkhead associated (FHA) protein
MADYAELVVQRGPEAGRGYMLVRAVLTVGRDPGNDIVIGHPEVSRQHTRIVRQGDQVVVEDMGSTNGTFVNGVLLKGPHALTDGDVLGLGDAVTLVYRAVEASAARTVVEQRAAPVAPAAKPARAEAPQAAAPPTPAAPEKEAEQGKGAGRRWITCGCVALVVACVAVAAFLFWMDAHHPEILYAPLEWIRELLGQG